MLAFEVPLVYFLAAAFASWQPSGVLFGRCPWMQCARFIVCVSFFVTGTRLGLTGDCLLGFDILSCPCWASGCLRSRASVSRPSVVTLPVYDIYRCFRLSKEFLRMCLRLWLSQQDFYCGVEMWGSFIWISCGATPQDEGAYS